MLFVPLTTGAIVGLIGGGRGLPLLLLVFAAFALFCLRTPVESLLGTTPLRAQTPEEESAVLRVIFTFSALALASLTALLWGGRNPYLLLIGAVALVIFLAQALVKKLGRSARMAAQIIGAVGLTSTAAAAYYVSTGHLDQRGLALWFANWVFAGNQIHFVQLRIRAARSKDWREKFAQGGSFFAGQIVMILVLSFAAQLKVLPVLVLLAFVPVLFRGIAWFFADPAPLRVKRLGIAELAHAITFGVLLVLAFTI
jgi:hypothetical protein